MTYKPGQPPHKIPATPGQSGSSGVYRTDTGHTLSLDEVEQKLSGFDRVTLKKGQVSIDSSIPTSFIQLKRFLEMYDFKHDESTHLQGDEGEATFIHQDGRVIVLNLRKVGDTFWATAVTAKDQGTTYSLETADDILSFVTIGKTPMSPENGDVTTGKMFHGAWHK